MEFEEWNLKLQENDKSMDQPTLAKQKVGDRRGTLQEIKDKLHLNERRYFSLSSLSSKQIKEREDTANKREGKVAEREGTVEEREANITEREVEVENCLRRKHVKLALREQEIKNFRF